MKKMITKNKKLPFIIISSVIVVYVLFYFFGAKLGETYYYLTK